MCLLPWKGRWSRDLPPTNRTSHISKESINPENDGHENKQIQRRITEWRRQLLENAAGAFGGGSESAATVDRAPLHAKIGQLTLENDFLESALTKAGLLSAKR